MSQLQTFDNKLETRLKPDSTSLRWKRIHFFLKYWIFFFFFFFCSRIIFYKIVLPMFKSCLKYFLILKLSKILLQTDVYSRKINFKKKCHPMRYFILSRLLNQACISLCNFLNIQHTMHFFKYIWYVKYATFNCNHLSSLLPQNVCYIITITLNYVMRWGKKLTYFLQWICLKQKMFIHACNKNWETSLTSLNIINGYDRHSKIVYRVYTKKDDRM